MSDTIYSPLTAFSPAETLFPVAETVAPGEDFIVNTQAVGMPSQPMAQAPASFPAYNPQFRTYTPPAPGSFDPLTVGITGAIPAFFGPRPVGTASEVLVTAADSMDGGVSVNPPPYTFVRNPPGVSTLPGGPEGGYYIRNPESNIPGGMPGTGNFLTDLQNAYNTPGMRDAALTMLTGPAAIPSIIAGTALSQFGDDPRVNTIGGALRDLLLDYFGYTAEERRTRRETARDLERESQRDSDTRSGITVEDLPPLQNITETYQPPPDTPTTPTPRPPESALDALYDTALNRDINTATSAAASQVGQDFTEGSSDPAEPGPAGAPGTGNFAQDFASFVSEPAVQDAALSFGLGALTGGIGPGIAAGARGVMSGGLADVLADQFGIDKTNVPSARDALASVFGYDTDISSPNEDTVSQAIAAEINDAIAAGFGPESSDYGDFGNNDTGGYGGGNDGGGHSGGGDGAGGEGGDAGGDGQGNKAGGLIKLAEGGLVPLAGGGKIAIGPGGGLDDLIPTSINGRRAAALSDGEFVIPADVVSMMGDGSSNAGARRFYDLVKQIRDAKTGTTKQAGPLPVGDILKRSMGR